jgi:hypothetical protein
MEQLVRDDDTVLMFIAMNVARLALSGDEQ